MGLEEKGFGALGGGGEAEAAFGGVVERGGQEPDATALLAVQQERLGKARAVGRHEEEE